MKAGIYYNNQDIRLNYITVPKLKEHDLLLKVFSSGICGSDVMEWYRIKRAPLVLGHEVAGQVEAVGKKVTHLQPGDRIFATHHVPCNICYYCLRGNHTACHTFQKENNFDPGGFSQYLRVSGPSVTTGILKLPAEVSYDQASFIEPLGTVIRGIRAIDLSPGESVAIFGAGIAGLLMIKAALAREAGNIFAIDINPSRLKAAKRIGAHFTSNPDTNVTQWIKDQNGGRLADHAIICTGALSAAQQALETVERGGTILFFAVARPGETLAIDFNPFWRNDITFKTSYGAAPADNHQALTLLQSGQVTVDDMISHRLPLAEIAKGFQMAAKGEGLKVIIKPWGDNHD